MPLFTIPCSFGEIIDKITILEIKLTKASGSQKANIQAEYDGLKGHLNPDLTPEKLVTFSKNLDNLRAINKRLWNLEDLIRQKSRIKSHDSTFIQLAEAIHMTNDERYRVKRTLNGLMDSTLVEEKIYEPTPFNIETAEDHAYFGRARKAFDRGDYETSFRIFEKLCLKFKESPASAFVCDLLSSYDTNAAFLGVQNNYIDLMDQILPQTPQYIKDPDHCKHILMNYGMHLMRRKEYSKATEYLRVMNGVNAPGISPETMSLPPAGTKGATLLVYMGGGIGDKIMFARFIPVLCEEQKDNSVVFLVDDNLYWIFSQVFIQPNLRIVPFSMRSIINFSHHCNIHMIHHWLGLEYEDILPLDYLRLLPIESSINLSKDTRKTVLINWHGNYANQLERLNRGMSLEQLVPLLAMKEIRWVSTQKEFSPDEGAILKKYGVLNLGPHVDKGGDSYKDTLAIMRQVDLVISTDTSFVHVAGTAGIPCWVLLTKGCEWRWTQDKITRWYPSLRLFRQKTVGAWASVVSEVKSALV
jgi:hypothetical protein